MLTFVGHWPAVDIPIPGTGLYARVPLSGVGHGPRGGDGHTHTHGSPAAGDQAQHAQHCHAESAGCSDTPLPGLSTVAMLREVLGFIGLGGAWHKAEGSAPAGLRAIALIPSDPPPRSALLLT